MSTIIKAEYDNSELTALKDKYGTSSGTSAEIFSDFLDDLALQALSSNLGVSDLENHVPAEYFSDNDLTSIEGTEIKAGATIATSIVVSETSY